MKTLNYVPNIVGAMYDYAINCGVRLNLELAEDIAYDLHCKCDDEYIEFDVEELDEQNGYQLFFMPNDREGM